MPLRGPSSAAEVAAFILFATIALLGALGTIASRSPIRSAVGLFFHILALAGLYLTLGAHFLGVIQLLVYAGAVVVLFVFVIMLLGPAATTARDERGIVPRILGLGAIVGVAGMIVPQLRFVQRTLATRPEDYGTLRAVGNYLYRDAVVPFELIGVTLVVAVVGAFAIARGHHKKQLSAGTAAELAAESTEAATQRTEAHT